MQKPMRNKGKKFEWSEEAQAAFENIKRELCEAPVLGMPTEEGMYVLDTGASVRANLRNTASGAGMEWKNSSPSHCIWQQGVK